VKIGDKMDPRLSRGMIFSLEGIDASGKKTQSMLIHKWLGTNGIPAEYDSFPDYSTVVGREISAFLSGSKIYPIEARHMLFSLNRLEHKERIEKWLIEGKIVVINRYSDSGVAYGSASGLSIEWLKSLDSQMPQPDYVFYLKARTELLKQRKSDRDTFELDLRFLERVSSVYDALAQSPNWFTIDADNSIESIHYEISRLAQKLLAGKIELKGRPINMNASEG
jgi:dTMP kinase